MGIEQLSEKEVIKQLQAEVERLNNFNRYLHGQTKMAGIVICSRYSADEQKLNKPARVGGTVFREGVSERLVIEAAQRHYEYMLENPRVAPYKIEELKALVRAE